MNIVHNFDHVLALVRHAADAEHAYVHEQAFEAALRRATEDYRIQGQMLLSMLDEYALDPQASTQSVVNPAFFGMTNFVGPLVYMTSALAERVGQAIHRNVQGPMCAAARQCVALRDVTHMLGAKQTKERYEAWMAFQSSNLLLKGVARLSDLPQAKQAQYMAQKAEAMHPIEQRHAQEWLDLSRRRQELDNATHPLDAHDSMMHMMLRFFDAHLLDLEGRQPWKQDTQQRQSIRACA